MASHLCALPDEVLALCLGALGVSELSALACTARRYLAAARADALWKPLFAARFEQPSRLASAAAQRAGGWAKLFADCAANEKRDAPWTTPAPLLLSAYVTAMCGARDDQLALLFLVDGRRGTRAAQRGPSCIALARWMLTVRPLRRCRACAAVLSRRRTSTHAAASWCWWRRRCRPPRRCVSLAVALAPKLAFHEA